MSTSFQLSWEQAGTVKLQVAELHSGFATHASVGVPASMLPSNKHPCNGSEKQNIVI